MFKLSTLIPAVAALAAFADAGLLNHPRAATAVQKTPIISPGNFNFSYYGCIKDITPANGGRILPTQLATPDPATVENCLKAASAYAYAGLEYGGECWASMTLDKTRAVSAGSSCTVPCTGNSSEYCGNAMVLQMYSRAKPLPPQPTVNVNSNAKYNYVGCVSEPPNNGRLLTDRIVVSTAMTEDWCLQLASASGYKYAGVENQNECWGGNTLLGPLKAAPASQCNMQCGGCTLQYCGGSLRLNLWQSK